MKAKNEILGNLYYKLGKQSTNFRIFHNFNNNGEIHFSKWVYYLDASEKDIEFASHRTLLKNEIVLDFDPNKDESFSDLQVRVINVCKDLKKKQVNYECYFTGSRGYHIHIFLDKMLFMDKEFRRKFRVNINKFFGSEVQKNSENVPIALENVTHWKSKKIKKRCFF